MISRMDTIDLAQNGLTLIVPIGQTTFTTQPDTAGSSLRSSHPMREGNLCTGSRPTRTRRTDRAMKESELLLQGCRVPHPFSDPTATPIRHLLHRPRDGGGPRFRIAMALGFSHHPHLPVPPGRRRRTQRTAAHRRRRAARYLCDPALQPPEPARGVGRQGSWDRRRTDRRRGRRPPGRDAGPRHQALHP